MQSFYSANSSRVRLDDYICDLNLEIAPGGYACHPLSADGFSYMWGGCKATHGIRSGKVCYEVKVVGYCDVSNKDMDSFVSRIGWSTDSATLQLGEDKNSFGFGGTGKKSVNRKFANYGRRFEKGDVVGCYLAMENGWVDISYSVNGRFCGSAFKIRWMTDEALFPHVLVKNCKLEVNFGQAPHPYFSLQPGFKLIDHIPAEFRIPAVRSPASQSDCEVIMMVGLPGVGKTTWAMNYAKIHPSKKYVLLGTDSIIDKMRVMGLPRKNNFGGRWDVLIKQASDCFNILLKKASNLPLNLILDQTNVYASARRRKVKQYREKGYTINAMVLVPRDEDMIRRSQQRTVEEGKEVPESAVLDMKANYSLPEENEHLFDSITFLELQRRDAQLLVEQYNMEAMSKGHRSNQQKGQGGNLNQTERNQSNRFSNQSMYQENHSRAPTGTPARTDDKYSAYSGMQSFAAKWEGGYSGPQKRPESSDYGPPEKYRRSESPGRMGYPGQRYNEAQSYTTSDPRQASYNQNMKSVEPKSWNYNPSPQDSASRGNAPSQAYRSEASYPSNSSMTSAMPISGPRADSTNLSTQQENLYSSTSRNQSNYGDVKTESSNYEFSGYPSSQRVSDSYSASSSSYYDEKPKQNQWSKNSDVQYGGTMDIDQSGFNPRNQESYGSGGNNYQRQPINSYGGQPIKADSNSWQNQGSGNYYPPQAGNSYPNSQGYNQQQDNYYPGSQYNAPKTEVKQEWSDQPFPNQYQNNQQYPQSNSSKDAHMSHGTPGYQEYRENPSQPRNPGSSFQTKEQSYGSQAANTSLMGRPESANQAYGPPGYDANYGNRDSSFQPNRDSRVMQQDYHPGSMPNAVLPAYSGQPDPQNRYGNHNQMNPYNPQNNSNIPQSSQYQPSVPARESWENYHERDGVPGRPLPSENRGPPQSVPMDNRNMHSSHLSQGDASYQQIMDSRRSEGSHLMQAGRQPLYQEGAPFQHGGSYENRYNRGGAFSQPEHSLGSTKPENFYNDGPSYEKRSVDNKNENDYMGQRNAQPGPGQSEADKVDNQSSRDNRRSNQSRDQFTDQQRDKRLPHNTRERSPRDDSRNRNRDGRSPHRSSKRENSSSRREERDDSRSRGSDRGRGSERSRGSDRRDDRSRSRHDDDSRRRDDRDRRENSRTRKDDRRSREKSRPKSDDKYSSGDSKDSSQRSSSYNRGSRGEVPKTNKLEDRSQSSKDRKAEPPRHEREPPPGQSERHSSAPIKHERPGTASSFDKQSRETMKLPSSQDKQPPLVPSASQRGLLPSPKGLPLTQPSPSDRAGLSNNSLKQAPEADPCTISKLASVDFDKLKASLASIRQQKLQAKDPPLKKPDPAPPKPYGSPPRKTHVEEINSGFEERFDHVPLRPRIPLGPRVRRPARMPMRGVSGAPGPRGMRPRMPIDPRFRNDTPRIRPLMGVEQQRRMERPRRALLKTPHLEPENQQNEEESYEDEDADYSYEDEPIQLHNEEYPVPNPRPLLRHPMLRGPRPMGMRRMMAPGRLRPTGLRPRLRPPGMRGALRPLFPRGIPRRPLVPRPGYM